MRELDSKEAWAWMRAHPGVEIEDCDGDLWSWSCRKGAICLRCEDGTWNEARGGEEGWSDLTWTVPDEPAKPAPIATIGAAIDWLLAHPGKTLTDNDGDLWRYDGRLVFRLTRSLDPRGLRADLEGWDLTWAPTPAKRVLPALPEGCEWREDAKGWYVYDAQDPGAVRQAIDNDAELACGKAAVAAYRFQRGLVLPEGARWAPPQIDDGVSAVWIVADDRELACLEAMIAEYETRPESDVTVEDDDGDPE